MLLLMIVFISLVDEIQFMLISSRHICIMSIQQAFRVHVDSAEREEVKN